MKKTAFLLFAMTSASTWAGCFGSGSMYTCYDGAGNSYQVNKMGGMTTMQGTNANGQTWNQTSTKVGNTTMQSGTAADGGRWSQTTNRIGNTTYNTGTDSKGNSFSRTCNAYGCY